MTSARVGYIGLGQMGSAMTQRLCDAGVAVTVFDLDHERVATAVAAGAVAAESPAAVARAADIVSVCVPAAAHIDAVLNGPDGVGTAKQPGQTLLIHSTVKPSEIVTFAAQADTWGASLHDACVAGGDAAARTGELVILAGGLQAMSDDAVELLDTYGTKVIDAGDVGAGASLKLGINVMTYAQFTAVSAAFDIVNEAGGSTDNLIEAWRHIGQLGKLTEQFLIIPQIPQSNITGAFRDGLINTASIATKDLDLAASEFGTTSPHHRTVVAMRDGMTTVFGVAEPDPSSDESPTQESNP